MGVEPSHLRAFTRKVLVAAGADGGDAERLSRILLWADSVGLTEYGVQRLSILCQRLEKRLIRSPLRPVWSELSGAIAHLDAADGFGHLAAELAAKKAVELAETHGIGAVAVSNSNHFGAAGYYAWLITQSSMIGLAFSNSFPKVAAYGGVKAVFGTNPMAFAAPIANDNPLLLDMATAAVAGSEIRRRAVAGLPLDPGMAVDAEGNPLLDASLFHDHGGIALPFGGAKGFGITILVETLAGVLSGGAIGSEVRSMYKDWTNPGRNGHFLAAIAPERLLPRGVFEERMCVLRDMIEVSGPGVRLPGRTRWRHYETTQVSGLDRNNLPIAELERLSLQYGIPATFLNP